MISLQLEKAIALQVDSHSREEEKSKKSCASRKRRNRRGLEGRFLGNLEKNV